MKRKIIMFVSAAALTGALLTGCTSSKEVEADAGSAPEAVSETEEASEPEAAAEMETESDSEAAAEMGTGSGSEMAAGTETESESGTASEAEAPKAFKEPENAPAVTLEDGTYTAEFDTDSSMFHISEACEGKGTLTVEGGEMVIHVSLASKNIVNLFPGLAEEARKEGAVLLEPTTDSVTYSDGITEEVYGFDIPVPALDEEFDVALIGKKGTWYDHKVCVTNPEKME